jgi:formylglycine-generating enzyme required for sulfatase activity
MIKKLLVVFVVLLIVLLAAGWLAYVLVPNERDQAQGLSRAVIADTDPADQPGDTGPTLLDIALSAENTTVGFSCAKTLVGKTLVVHGGWNNHFNSVIEGAVGVDPITHEPRVLRAKIRIDSLWSEHDLLTEALLSMGFFHPAEHPWAEFEGRLRLADPADGDPEAPTSVVAGQFVLNGIVKQIEFPARIELTGDMLSITSEFSLDRHAFDVKFKEAGAFGLLTDDDIADLVAVTLRVNVPLTESAATPVGDQVQATSPTPAPAPAPRAADVPGSYTQTIPSSQIQFEMVLVPGDAESGAEPFYLEKHEVTWDEFMPWVEGRDLDNEALVGEERAMKLRPSSPYGSVDRNFGMYRRPALGMSRLAAERYCKWLSEQTGRAYRLPTEAEWCRAYVSGGGNLDESPATAQADRIATYKDNSWNDSVGDWSTSKVLKREPNTLGIHDMAGNVAEWVTATGEEHVVRGGHFESPRSELGVGRAVEDMDVWNRDYPNEPKSQWWYVNARWVGFRVACDP